MAPIGSFGMRWSLVAEPELGLIPPIEHETNAIPGLVLQVLNNLLGTKPG